MKKEIIWIVLALALATAPFGCVLRDGPVTEPVITEPVTPPPAGQQIVDVIETSTVEDAVGAASLLIPGAAPYVGIGLLIWRLIRKHKAGVGVAQSVQEIVNALPAEKKAELGENQSNATKTLIRQSRGKTPNIPL